MIDDIPLLAIKYPTPKLIKKVGVMVVDVRIGVTILATSLPKILVNKVFIKSLDRLRYEQV